MPASAWGLLLWLDFNDDSSPLADRSPEAHKLTAVGEGANRQLLTGDLAQTSPAAVSALDCATLFALAFVRSGPYMIRTGLVYCLMDAELGGGWTLVANQANEGAWASFGHKLQPTLQPPTQGYAESGLSWDHSKSYYRDFYGIPHDQVSTQLTAQHMDADTVPCPLTTKFVLSEACHFSPLWPFSLCAIDVCAGAADDRRRLGVVSPDPHVTGPRGR